jgi:hypothetical protein
LGLNPRSGEAYLLKREKEMAAKKPKKAAKKTAKKK